MSTDEGYSRPIPLLAIVLVALAVHGPLLLMQLPAGSFDTNFHIFFASHYVHHWFDPWNEKWFAGFSQTTYPPLTHQWIALLSNVVGLKMGYMIVQLIAVLLLPVGVFRFARIWVEERAASYAALGSVFLGALAFLVYQAGQLATVASAALYLNALPYFYEWITESSGRSLLKGVAISWAAAAAHHVTLIFGVVLFAGPVLWVAWLDARDERVAGSVAGVLSRAVVFGVVVALGGDGTRVGATDQSRRHPRLLPRRSVPPVPDRDRLGWSVPRPSARVDRDPPQGEFRLPDLPARRVRPDLNRRHRCWNVCVCKHSQRAHRKRPGRGTSAYRNLDARGAY